MFKRYGVIFVVGLLVLAASAPSASAGPTARPFKGSVAGAITIVVDGNCPILGLRTDTAARGPATLLGMTSMSSDHCTPAGDLITGGQMTFVAANGNELSATYEGTVAPFEPILGTILTADVQVDIDGGTGRFEGATGHADMTAYITFSGYDVFVWPGVWAWEGTLSY